MDRKLPNDVKQPKENRQPKQDTYGNFGGTVRVKQKP